MKLDTDLQEEIELAAERIAEASHAAAIAAVHRAFGREEKQAGHGRKGRATGQRRRPSARRTPAELEALAEGLLKAIQANPGQGMSVLAESLGTTPQALQHAVARLKADGTVRTTGRRQAMRYFPLSTRSRR